MSSVPAADPAVVPVVDYEPPLLRERPELSYSDGLRIVRAGNKSKGN